ncbi:hypothetical protein HNP52_002609 [Sphingomonas kyeonggiensis]|uniref:Uncharacterized protein n=1 Tax=Sphingomonas kyeonggiensis TaxID=1268553 RepID=A0A7W7NRS0_9SPHN|nr:hypothetical protein [Sphingomonas kyeonggiensis]
MTCILLPSVTPPPFPVIPAKAGIQGNKATSSMTLDPRLRGDDEGNWKAEGITA